MSVLEVSANSSYTYYSKKAWKSYNNLIDVESNNIELGFTNSKNIYTQVIALENENYLQRQSTDYLNGKSSLQVTESENFNQIYFSLKFSEAIKIGNVKVKLSANDKNGNKVKKTIYAGPIAFENGKLNLDYAKIITSTTENDYVILNLNNIECKQISIVFDNKIGNKYDLSYFQVLDYQKLEHSYWTSNYIEDTTTKTITLNEGTGNYLPDGTNNKWVQGFSTSFSPNVNLIKDYNPKLLKSYFVAYDIKVDNVNPKTSLDVLTPKLDDRITGWEGSGNIYFSLGSESKYLKTNKTAGHRFLAYKTHWDYIPSNYFAVSTSCKYLTGSSKKPCYEHEGHVYGNGNVYDIMRFEYVNVYDEKDKAIDKVSYSLCDLNLENCSKLVDSSEKIKKIELNDSGSFIIKSNIFDVMGNSKAIYSKPFLIDNDIPLISYEYKQDDRILSVNVKVIDALSKVEKLRYQVSKDGGKTYSEFSDFMKTDQLSLNFNQSGEYIINVEATDYAGNIASEFSDLKSIQVSDFEIAYAYAHVYEKDEENYLFFELKCDSNELENYEVEVKKDGKSIFKEKGELKEKKLFKIKYLPNQIETDLEILINKEDKNQTNNIVKIKTYEKSRAKITTDSKLLNFKEPVVSLVNGNGKQVDYYEYLNYEISQDVNELKAGSGIEISVTPTINNTCFEVINGKCSLNQEIIGEIKIEFNEEQLKSYQNMSLVNNRFVLKQVYLDLKSGEIIDLNSGVNGGRKWYTAINLKPSNYSYHILGTDLGVNRISFDYLGEYNITGDLYKDFIVRFLDLENPFPNHDSQLWKDKSIFNTIKGNLIKTFLIQNN